MNMLTCYDQAMSALSNALHSRDVSVVLRSRADLDLIKHRARQIKDRKLLADAIEFQMRVERWLGALLIEAKAAGHLREGARPKISSISVPATLAEIGVDRKLSMNAQHAAKLAPEAFSAAVVNMRERISSGKAMVVSAIDGIRKNAKGLAAARPSSYRFQLSDGIPIGQVNLGKLRSRIENLAAELNILQAVSDRVGSDYNALATVEDAIGETVLDQILRSARAVR